MGRGTNTTGAHPSYRVICCEVKAGIDAALGRRVRLEVHHREAAVAHCDEVDVPLYELPVRG